MANSAGPKPAGAALLQAWLHQSKDQGVIVLDRHGVILEWLAGTQEVLGYSAQEAVGHHIAMIFTHEDRSKGYPDHELAVAARDRSSEDSRWHVRRDGTRIWATGSVTAIRPRAGGEVQGFVKVLRDATDERAHVERLEQEVQALGRARQDHRQFLRGLGHEIRNPLSVMANAAALLERLVTDERGRKSLQLIEVQVDVLRRMADDLRDLSQPEPGRVRLEKSRIDLRDVMREVGDAMQAVAEDKAVAIQVLLPPSALWVDADAARMRQVLVNLVGNAIKYNKGGGNVWMNASVEGNEVVCRISDDGLGIFPPVLPRLFELFTEAGDGAERQGDPGVGLVLVRQLVELHGGTVQAKSAGLGKGAEFSFRLPVAGATGGA